MNLSFIGTDRWDYKIPDIDLYFQIVWLETPTNPNCRVIDIAATVQIVKKRNENIIVVVDNTFLTCYLQRPLDFGADIVVYSLTKYVNGHSDVVMGAAVVNKQEIADNLRYIQECEF